MFNTPGALTMYSTAERKGLTPEATYPASPFSHDIKSLNFQKRDETVAPFDTSAKQRISKTSSAPSPSDYYADKPWRFTGSPLMRGKEPRLTKNPFLCESPGAIYKLPDPWVKLLHDAMDKTKKPRIKCDLYVSNNVPTVYHPMDIRCFIDGMDSRPYPWRLDRRYRVPAANAYDISKCYRSQTKLPFDIKLSGSSKRTDFITKGEGCSPAAYCVPQELNQNGGLFLSKTKDPLQSAPRIIDIIHREIIRRHYPSPFDHWIPTCFDRPSSRAVSAPFKSKSKQRVLKIQDGPCALEYFRTDLQEDDLDNPLVPGISTRPPVPLPFATSEKRFRKIKGREDIPGPGYYNIMTFTDEMNLKMCKAQPAIKNPKLGFLTSSASRPVPKPGLGISPNLSKTARKWKNIRPKKGKTYTFFGAPPKFSTPGPKYDISTGYLACKAKHSWWDPRHDNTTGFMNSGCGRIIGNYLIDVDNPGPAAHTPIMPWNTNGRVYRTEKRFRPVFLDSPGPIHKPHEKIASSTWRSTHLGTFNAKLKRVKINPKRNPTAGGFRPYGPLDNTADLRQNIRRIDFYADKLCPDKSPTYQRCGEAAYYSDRPLPDSVRVGKYAD